MRRPGGERQPRAARPSGDTGAATTDPTQDTYDRYDRLLAYVETRSGRQLNVTQVANGWAEVYVFRRPFGQLRRFRAAEQRARSASRGVWGACGGDFHSESASATAAAVGLGVPQSHGAR